MSDPEEQRERGLTEPIRHPPTANPTRTRLGSMDIDPKPEEADPTQRPRSAEET